MPEPKKSGNQACSEAMRERAYKQHRERLAATKPSIDTSAPESAAYTRHVGRQSNQQKKYDQVDRDNQVLVERLVHVMNTKGGVDNSEPWRDHNKAVDSQRRRQKKQDAIDAENQRMLQRLQNARATYSSDKLKKDRKNNETYANRISRYPYRPMDRPEPIPDLEAEERRRQQEEQEGRGEGDEDDYEEEEEERVQQQEQQAPARQQTPPQAPPPHPEDKKEEEDHSEDYEDDDFEDDAHSEDDSYHEIGSSEDESKKRSEDEIDGKEL